MIGTRSLKGTTAQRAGLAIGPAGHLALFFWSLAMVMLVPAHRIQWAAALCLAVAVVVHPLSCLHQGRPGQAASPSWRTRQGTGRYRWRRLLRARWLLFLALMALPPVFLLGEVDRTVLGVGVSSEGLLAGMQIALRFVVVMVAVDGLTATVDISALAGLLERFGLQGLGFSLGVALNLLPVLQQSSVNAWHSLWLRGGLRHRRWRSVRLLLVTVVSNALRRAEEIALAAEARAFAPERARPMPVAAGRLDVVATALASVALVLLCVVR
jgi:energy-coupling factor transporter transmembrane protein EcfT